LIFRYTAYAFAAFSPHATPRQLFAFFRRHCPLSMPFSAISPPFRHASRYFRRQPLISIIIDFHYAFAAITPAFIGYDFSLPLTH
jgi:hypothetical protein